MLGSNHDSETESSLVCFVSVWSYWDPHDPRLFPSPESLVAWEYTGNIGDYTGPAARLHNELFPDTNLPRSRPVKIAMYSTSELVEGFVLHYADGRHSGLLAHSRGSRVEMELDDDENVIGAEFRVLRNDAILRFTFLQARASLLQ